MIDEQYKWISVSNSYLDENLSQLSSVSAGHSLQKSIHQLN
ncbi:hypothetical protein DFA_06271 [Cavenderia fasciculata]|uniref:Uncharacterized protein n=1 Tax=Cavenderia fasciculata TaxID=261658 RepID=F4PKK6_CACFS|nr:uncharacterized protein DFA_06271 [Cavenderia fasciculata]EGG24130.1 hypothetical protein DFA_06271 [Cavenderia fasciculata]|eukprot:XP_004361981.1 hypothetical protein DFA_06271 [Cavenderia fasciculata]